jgi:hypothetical protein
MPVGAVGQRAALFQRPRGRVCASTGRAASTGGVGVGEVGWRDWQGWGSGLDHRAPVTDAPRLTRSIPS